MHLANLIKAAKDKMSKQLSTFVKKYQSINFMIEVHKKFNEDEGGYRVGAITYYMFLSVLPLLLASLTLFDIIFAKNEELRRRMIDSTFSAIPVIGPTLESDLTFVKDRGWTLVISLLILVWAGKGGALALQNSLWRIFKGKRLDRSFISQHWRAYFVMFIISVGIIIPTAATSIMNENIAIRMLIFIVSILWNMGLIYLIFSVSVSSNSAKGYGPIIGGVAISVIQLLSIFIVERSLHNARPLYGTFAVALTLMAWIALQVRVLLIAAEINYVRSELAA